MRDAQRQKVYDWERSGIIAPEIPLSLDGCRQLIHHVCDEYGRRYPQVWDGGNDRGAYASSRGIKLPGWAQTAKIALHEVAHWILLPGWEIESHGPEYVKLYVDLLVRYHYQDASQLLASLAWAGIAVAPSNAAARPRDKPLVWTSYGAAAKRRRALAMLEEADAEIEYFKTLAGEGLRKAASKD